VKGKSSQEKEMSRERVLKRNRCQGKDVKSQKDGKKKKVKIEMFARQVCSFLLKVLVCKAL
jgi:hypothetical protein